MIQGYRCIRGYCHTHEWAAALSAILLLFLLTASIFFALEYQGAIWQWLANSLLIHGLMMIAAMVLASMFCLSLLCLSFCPDTDQDRAEMARYRQRSALNESLELIRNLGGNPKRRHRRVHNASA